MALRILIVIFILTATLNLKGQTCNKSVAKACLTSLFPDGKYISKDSIVFRKYRSDLNPLKTPILNKLLPECCFYTTILWSPYYEYRNVQTLLVVRRDTVGKSQVLLSPTFKKEPEEFFQIFYGIQTIDSSQSLALSNEISSILSSITYAGHAYRILNLTNSKVISFELWHDDLSWRIYDFYFNDKNILQKIDILPGFKRSQIEGYKRL